MDYARKQKSRDIKKSLKIHLFKQLTLGFAGFAERTNFLKCKIVSFENKNNSYIYMTDVNI